MKYNFDEAVERRGTGCLKYDFAKERGKKEDVLPLWVADMDFKTAPAVTERLQKVVEHGIYGYSDSKEDYFAAVSGWYHDHFDWDVKPEWLVKTPGVVFALAAAVRAYTEKEDVLPLWVADMDFKTAPAVTERLQKVVEHGIYGYSDSKEDYFAAVSGWYHDHFDWDVKPEWLVKTPGVVFALAAAVRAYTEKGDTVLIQQPVYYPFRQVIESNDRKLVSSDLVLKDDHYEIDFEDFEAKIKEHQIHLFLLCSPHNPVGRVWKEWELRKIGEICFKYQVTVVSDEIHSDFVYPGHKHHVFASVSPEFEQISVICTAPSKTFNLAGLQVSNIFIADEKLRQKFVRAVDQAGYSQVNLMGLVGCQAAYEEGEEWLLQLKEYLYQNLSFVREYLRENLPQIKLIEPEGTYLIWLDFGELGLGRKELEALIDQAGLWLDAGAIFGKTGIGFERINIACPRKTLEQAFLQLKKAVDALD